jgi:hypothetical protein
MLATANPIGSIVAHPTMHGTAVAHAYETPTVPPPETQAKYEIASIAVDEALASTTILRSGKSRVASQECEELCEVPLLSSLSIAGHETASSATHRELELCPSRLANSPSPIRKPSGELDAGPDSKFRVRA